MEQHEEEKAPRRVNDPRDRPNPGQPRPVAGRKRGVGYIPRGLSYAGVDHGYKPVPFDLSVSLEGVTDPKEYIETRARMVAGGNVDQSQRGAPGIKPDQCGQILRRAWEARAAFLVSPEEYDGLPTETEVQRLFYAQKGADEVNAFAATIFGMDNPSQAPKLSIPGLFATTDALVSGILALPGDQRAALGILVAALQSRQEIAFTAGDEEKPAAGGNWKPISVGDTYDFSMGLRGMAIPAGASRVRLRGTLTLPPSRPPGSLWPIIGPALGDRDRKRVKPATLTINNKEAWRLEGPGIQGEQIGTTSKVPWGLSGSLEVRWDADLVNVAFEGITIFNEEMAAWDTRKGVAAWDTRKGGILWFGVDPGGEYSPLLGGRLLIESVDFGGSDTGWIDPPGDDVFDHHIRNIRAELGKLERALRG